MQSEYRAFWNEILEEEFDRETAASRVGNRIRKIRTEKKLSQAELGELIGLTANRMQQYENGVRKPKSDLLKMIAASLDVRTLALVDPITTNYIGAMFALFELENNFNMKVIKINDEEEGPSIGVSVHIRENLYKYMKKWHDIYEHTNAKLEIASSDEEKEQIIKSYNNWKWNFPQIIFDKSEKALMKSRLKNKIIELQRALDKLDEE